VPVLSIVGKAGIWHNIVREKPIPFPIRDFLVKTGHSHFSRQLHENNPEINVRSLALYPSEKAILKIVR
jgi:hypothetical protein